MKKFLALVCVVAMSVSCSLAADNLKLNQHLDYSSDSHDGPRVLPRYPSRLTR